MSDENRIERVSAAISPTGAPMLPAKAVPWLVALVGVAGVAAQVLPEHTVAHKIALAVMGFGALLGIASPGWRK